MEIDEKLLDAYYQGHCNEEERKAVEEWIRMEDYENYRLTPPGHLQDEIWNGVSERISTTSKSYRTHYWTAAACIALVCAAFLTWQFLRPAKDITQFAQVKTLKGQRAKVILPDGTVVHLNANSSLSYPEKFDNVRQVTLSGEAYFEVTKMPEKPFVVTGKTTRTRVLGTSFNLVERGSKRSLTVLTGKVSYQNTQSSQLINVTPNERVELKQDGQFEKRNVYARKSIAWQEDKLLFENTKMSDVAMVLEDWYGIDIKITDSKLSGQSFTGQFDHPQLGSVLHTIGFALKFNYRQTKEGFVLFPE